MLFDRKKMNFIYLAIAFAILTVLSLYSTWSQASSLNMQSTMMDESMGGMMAMMHLENASIASLVMQQEQMEAASDQTDHGSHHSEGLGKLHYLITATIIILLPIIIAGTVFLAVAWYK
ncbi:MAG: hypothetical protein ACOZCL_13425 [Bacillota bacterium]